MAGRPPDRGAPADTGDAGLRDDAYGLDEIERIRAAIVDAGFRETDGAQEVDRRLPPRVRHRQQAELARLATGDDAVFAHLAHAVGEELVAHLRVRLLDQRVPGRRVREIAAPAFGRCADEALQ